MVEEGECIHIRDQTCSESETNSPQLSNSPRRTRPSVSALSRATASRTTPSASRPRSTTTTVSVASSTTRTRRRSSTQSRRRSSGLRRTARRPRRRTTTSRRRSSLASHTPSRPRSTRRVRALAARTSLPATTSCNLGSAFRCSFIDDVFIYQAGGEGLKEQ